MGAWKTEDKYDNVKRELIIIFSYKAKKETGWMREGRKEENKNATEGIVKTARKKNNDVSIASSWDICTKGVQGAGGSEMSEMWGERI